MSSPITPAGSDFIQRFLLLRLPFRTRLADHGHEQVAAVEFSCELISCPREWVLPPQPPYLFDLIVPEMIPFLSRFFHWRWKAFVRLGVGVRMVVCLGKEGASRVAWR